jgi:UDP-N-acetylmuramoyl-tripeptide--D-alanyl-D-alanine ligase
LRLLEVIKTTTKELIHVVLPKNIGQKQRLVTSIIISACLDVIILTAETEIGIVEMGANHKNEIEFFANCYA